MVDVRQSEGSADVLAGRESGKGWLNGILTGLFALRVPLVIGLATVAVLTVPDQMREIHRILTQERTENILNWHWVLCVLSLVALSIVIWITTRQHAEDFHDEIAGEPGGTLRWMLAWGPRLLATLPLLGAALGIWLSRSSVVRLDDINVEDIPENLRAILKQQVDMGGEFTRGVLVCVALAVLVFILVWLFERNLAPMGSRRARRVATLNNWLLFPLFILASIGLLIYYPVWLPQQLGSIPIFALWMANIAVLLALFWGYSRIIGFPILALLIALLIAFESSGRTDNHQFRHQVVASGIPRPSVEESFRTWLGSRADLEAYRSAGKPYPVYIVAAEGGGLYAAYQTAKLLGRMQDLCRNFAQHVFVTSAVSGGSLGAAVFSGLTQEYAKNEPAQPCLQSLPEAGQVEKAADTILSKDLLSPVIWATLFPDFLQRFVPYPFPKLDRGYTLELAFEDTWNFKGGPKKNYLQGSFFNLCGADAAACAKGATPALAVNMSNVETGMQMVLSQMDLSNWPLEDGPPRPFDVFSNGADPVDLTVSTAVGLSARFPWISPQGWYTFNEPGEVLKPGERPSKRRMSFVDGGYVDNSGVVTATKIARLLTHITSKDPTLPKVDIKLIVISAAWIPFDRFWIDPPRNESLSEYVSPFVAALAAWQGRGYTAQADVTADRLYSVIDMGVYYNFMPLPVGWHLSTLSRKYIDQFKGHPEKCDELKARPSSFNHATMAGSYIYQANCSAAKIIKDLTPK
jgi:hypothetical protein